MAETHNLVKEGQALLELARNEGSGRSSVSLGHADKQRAVLMALTAGNGLSEHDSPPSATLQCISGNVRLYVAGGGEEWLLQDGDLVPIPQARHGVDAISDSIILLTVSL